MINLQALTKLSHCLPSGSTFRVERLPGLMEELEFATLTNEERENHPSWPPEPRPGETLIAWGLDEKGVPVAVFLKESEAP